MGLLKKVREINQASKGLFGVDFGIPGVDTWQFAQDWNKGILARDPDRVDQPYAQVGPFQRVVSVISRDAASVDMEFFAVDAQDNPSDEPVENHPVKRLWQNPNGHMIGNQLLIGSYISKLVFGEYIWYYPDLRIGRRTGVRANERSTGEVFLLYPPAVRRKLNEAGEIDYRMKDESGEEIPLDREKLTHSRRYNPYSQVTGLPLAASIMADLVGYYAAAKWNERFFNEQNGVPTLVIIPGAQGSWTKADERETFLRRFSQRHGERRTVGMLPGGFDLKDFGVSQRDMDFAELRQFGRDEILANAGVPPLIAGYLTRPITYNASEQKELYWESTITNFVIEEQMVINADFLPKIGVAERVYPDWEKVKALLENLAEKTEVAVKWFDMGLSKRQINERLEMGWDETLIEDYDVGYITFNRLPLALIADPSLTSVYVQPKEPKDGEPEDGGDDDGNGEADEKGVRESLTEFRRLMIWRNLVARTRDLEARFSSLLRAHFQNIQQEVLDNLAGVKGWLARQDGEDETFLGDLFDVGQSKRKLQRSSAPLHRASLVRGGESAMFDIGIGIDFDPADPTVSAKLAELTGKIVRIDDTVEDALRQSLAQGLGAGESPDQLARRVRQVMDASKARSMAIARTETGQAFAAGRKAGMEQAGIERHQWLTARDTRVRDSHRIDGQVREIGQPFSNGLLHPLDSSAPADELVNCRCAVLPVLEGPADG